MTSTKSTKRTPYTVDTFAVEVADKSKAVDGITRQRALLAYYGTVDGVLTSGGKNGTMSRDSFGAAFGVSGSAIRWDQRRGRVLAENGLDSKHWASVSGRIVQTEAFKWLADPKEKFSVKRFTDSVKAAKVEDADKGTDPATGRKSKRSPRPGSEKKTPEVTTTNPVADLVAAVAATSKMLTAGKVTVKQWEAILTAEAALVAAVADHRDAEKQNAA